MKNSAFVEFIFIWNSPALFLLSTIKIFDYEESIHH